MRRFRHGVDLIIHRFEAASRGRLTKVSEHELPGVGIGRPNSQVGTYPVEIPETSRVCITRDYHADVRSGDYVTFPEGHRLSGSWWKVQGEVLDVKSPFTGWEAGLTFRIERGAKPAVT